MTRTRYLYIESMTWSLFSALVYLLFDHFQPMIRLNGGQGWDGTQYFGMFEYFRHGIFTNYLQSSPLFPFNQRPLGPFLASFLSAHFSFSPIRSFKTLHIFSISATSGLLYFIFVKHIGFDRFVSSLALIWLLFNALAYTRLAAFYPFLIDSLAMLALALLLYLVVSNQYIFLPLLTIFSCMIKEQFLAFLIAILAYELFKVISGRTTERKRLLIVSISVLIDISINYYIRHYVIIAPGSSFYTMLSLGYQRFKHPLSFVRYVVSYFMAFGAFGLSLLYYFKRTWNQILQLDSYRLVGLFSLEFMAFGLLAGSDMDRILWSGFPFLMTMMLLATRGLNRRYILALFLFTVPLMHLNAAIPQPSHAWPNNDSDGLYSWMMEYADPGKVAMWGIYMCITWTLIGQLRFLNKPTLLNECESASTGANAIDAVTRLF